MKSKREQHSKTKNNSPGSEDQDNPSSRRTYTDQDLATFIRYNKYKCINSHKVGKDAYEVAKILCKEEQSDIKIKKKHRRRYSAQDCANSELINELVGLQDKMMDQARRIMNNNEVKYTRNENNKDKEQIQRLKRIEKSQNLIGALSRQSVLQRVMEKTPARTKNVAVVVQKKDTMSFISSEDISFSESKILEITKYQEGLKREKFKQIARNKNAGQAYACERKKQSWMAFKQIQRIQSKCTKNKIIQTKKKEKKAEQTRRDEIIKLKKKEDCMLTYRSANQRTKILKDYQNRFKEVTNLFCLNLDK